MGAIDLDSDAFWESDEPVVMWNPRFGESPAALTGFVRGAPDLAGHVLFRTSGSSGAAKLAALSKKALLASAAAVNRHLDVTAEDRWLRAVPAYHVGGLGIHARARIDGTEVAVMDGAWDAGRFAEMGATRGATLSALVPTQVYDLVKAGAQAPEGLRAVLVGGGFLAPSLWRGAVELGWPVLRTYGMTEAASQVATERARGDADDAVLPVLDHWQVRTGEAGALLLKGPALLSAYVVSEDEGIRVIDPREDGWFRTSDRVALSDEGLRFVEREGEVVKIFGELVSLGAIRRRLETIAPGERFAVVARDDLRRGVKLVLVAEDDAKGVLEALDEGAGALERIEEVVRVERMPRTEIGKIDYGKLGEL